MFTECRPLKMISIAKDMEWIIFSGYILLLLVTSSRQQDLAFVTNAGVGRYTFSYNEYAMDTDGMVIIGSLPPGLFSVSCLLGGQSSSTVTYSLDGEVFQVDTNTGALSLQDGMELDFEESNNIQFSVNCFAPSAARNGTAQVEFRVLPVNEFPPVLSVRSLFVRTREDLPIGTILVSTQTDVGALATFSATDDDGGPDGELEYTLTFNENLTSYAVDRFSGTLIVTQSLDVDNTPFGFVVEVIRLTVCDIKPAVDSCPAIEVSVVITSANDNSPVFTQDFYEASILEDTPVGSNIVNVSCTDADIGAGSFKNVTSSVGLFNVSAGEQVVSLAGELDFETARVHNVTLTCHDFAGGIARATLIVRVLKTTQIFINTRTLLVPVREDVAIGTVLVSTRTGVGALATFSAIDGRSGEPLTYSLVNSENVTSFAVHRFSGTLTVSQSLDVDDTSLGFKVEVIGLTVCDVDPPVSSCPNVEVTLVITAANDNSPIFTRDIYEVSIPENTPTGSIIANVSCTDADVTVGHFENVVASTSLFNVTANLGVQVVLLADELDFDTARVHNVTLTCYDSEGDATTAALIVTVLPVNDNQPRFNYDKYYLSFTACADQILLESEIGRVEATDEDQLTGGNLTYNITENSNFDIRSGGLIVLMNPAVKRGVLFTLDVGVSDGEFSDTAVVGITIKEASGSGVIVLCSYLVWVSAITSYLLV